MGYYSYATLFVLVCAAILAATPPSTAQQDITLNFTGNLACEAIENGIQVNTTINLMCDTLSPGLQLGLAGVAMTQSGGSISGFVVLNLLQILTPFLSIDPRNLERSCFLSAPTGACADGVTPASTAQRPLGEIIFNVTGVLLCGNDGAPPAANARVQLVNRSLLIPLVLGSFHTTTNGTINVSFGINKPLIPFFSVPLTARGVMRFCYLRASAQICTDSLTGNPARLPFQRASINATITPGNPPTVYITPAGRKTQTMKIFMQFIDLPSLVSIMRQDAATSEDISVDDLKIEVAGDVLELSYPCRCGDFYVINSLDLADIGCPLVRHGRKIFIETSKDLPASVVLPCGSCSLKVRLLINPNTRMRRMECLKIFCSLDV
nr:DPH4 homolog [Ipomoea batatas]